MGRTNRYYTNGVRNSLLYHLILPKYLFLPLPIISHQVLPLNERFWCIYEQPVVREWK